MHPIFTFIVNPHVNFNLGHSSNNGEWEKNEKNNSKKREKRKKGKKTVKG